MSKIEIEAEQFDEITGRLKNLEYLLNQIVLKKRKWRKVPKEGLIISADAAHYLGITVDELHKLAKAGELNRYQVEGQINNSFLYSQDDLKDFIKRR